MTEVLAQLSLLLPSDLCHFRKGTSPVIHPCTRSVAYAMLRDALENGYTVDRTNADGPLSEWDGWLVIDTPETQTFLQTNGRINLG